MLLFLTSFFAAMVIGFALGYPLVYSIEFTVQGHEGDEKIRVTKNWGTRTILPTFVLGKDWNVVRITSYWPVVNLRIYCLTLDSMSPPRQITIRGGVVRVYRKNLLGNLVTRQDWLNVDTRYFRLDGRPFLADDSEGMSTVRGGITGWTGYYELVPD